MAMSRPPFFQPKVIAGLPDAFKPTPTEDPNYIIPPLEELKKHLILKASNEKTKATESDITFDVCEKESSSSDDTFIANTFDHIHTQRENTLYHSLRKKIMTGQALVLNEILYFSLITENVNLLTDEMMLTLKSTNTPYTTVFSGHINLLFYCKKLSLESTQKERERIKTNIEDALKIRSMMRSDLTFCNLASINFSGLNFNGSSFQWLNLENANFSNCTFNDCVFKNCLLKEASFERSTTLTTLITQGLSFLNCPLNKANFSNTAVAMQAKGCQLDSAAFTQADINASFNGCTLKNCDFTKAVISPRTSIDSLSLSGCHFSGVTLNTLIKSALIDINVTLFTPSELSNPRSLNERLNMLAPPSTFDAKQLSDYRRVIANVLLNQLKDINEDTKKAAITTALQHSLFASKNMFKQSLNGVVSFCGFFSAPLFETTAESLLKNALLPPTAPPLWTH
ncbi:MAG TPA: pentapeptide repeat-containing protein [Gammaproteobacteria bacterium]|nr:pentapeptide repeat-containing protein [Gammaproteobacteria bacterium]